MAYYVEAYSKSRHAEQSLRHIGTFETLEGAISASKSAVDEALMREHERGMSGEELFEKFKQFGEMPCIFLDEDKTLSGFGFNALNYAKVRAEEMCRPPFSLTPPTGKS